MDVDVIDQLLITYSAYGTSNAVENGSTEGQHTHDLYSRESSDLVRSKLLHKIRVSLGMSIKLAASIRMCFKGNLCKILFHFLFKVV